MPQSMDTKSFRFHSNGRSKNRAYKRKMEKEAREKKAFQKEILKKYDVEHKDFWGDITKDGDNTVFTLSQKINNVPQGVYVEYSDEYGCPVWTKRLKNGSVVEIPDSLISNLWEIFGNPKKFNVKKHY